jgi:hypothetical protein
VQRSLGLFLCWVGLFRVVAVLGFCESHQGVAIRWCVGVLIDEDPASEAATFRSTGRGLDRNGGWNIWRMVLRS